ncbi:MAG TPA: spore coat protein [Firmicutes bacterium]|jgi:spore coat protein CotF|nr:spore coat protein [Bacillota bacterium]HAA34103.1 spore coat protein [Bacillota bacterium]
MTLKLTQKEQMLLQDQKSHEEICIQKYKNYAEQAQDPQLKQMFSSFAEQEQQHWNTINQILSGQVPDMSQQQNQGQGQQYNPAASEVKQQMKGAMGNQGDASLCTDMLMTEKYVSGTYDTAIFECVDTNVRQALNHIQKEEQQHGEAIFNYMKNKGMYNPK